MRRTVSSLLAVAGLFSTVAFALITVALSSPMAQEINYNIMTLSIPGAHVLSPNGINSHGDIVGRYDDSNGRAHGFLYKDGEFTILDLPGAQFTIFTGINNIGQIVGFTDISSFIYSDGSFRPLNVPGNGAALGLNDRGQIVGGAGAASFLYNLGKFTTFSIPGARVTTARGINNAGEIVGDFEPPGTDVTQAFTYDGTKFRIITVPGHSNTGAFGINNRGEIVGPTDNGLVSFANRGGDFDLFAVPTAQSTIASGVNDRGVIVGEYSPDGVVALGLVATPVPGRTN
jgi:probable HAF family extracellular repeat protein